MGVRTPEELESLFEDALLLRDDAAVAALFERGATLVADGHAARGGAAIACAALANWSGEHVYVAHPQRVVLARDIALIVAERGVNVARRDGNGVWRYAIVLQEVEDGLAAKGGVAPDRELKHDGGGE